ncbi:hypothetical protein [Rhodococcus sp. 14-2483-1-2]|uniref:hypothetical protein n=1 Tax=Rhodococcus sp. 14-2483-1-2 TaxID=2023147 RepID=UPI000B9B4187|nr:hypothetical protein [Rhodococcus sp. 14-2483-1-2]OZF39595.1 hypothetical protein CH295_02465 [Rhodococcus sp. 14-2483-1-2]
MGLPKSARLRLAGPLIAARRPSPFRNSSTLPIERRGWDEYAGALESAVRDLITMAPPLNGFNEIRRWVDEFCTKKDRIVSLLLALQPFEPFSSGRAETLLDSLEAVARVAATAVTSGLDHPGLCPDPTLDGVAAEWAFPDSANHAEGLLQAAFCVSEPLTDDSGDFRPDWVLSHYAYRGTSLLSVIAPHLQSLGLPMMFDHLAALNTIGLILDSDDPVHAYISLDTFVKSCFQAETDVAAAAREHLEGHEPAMTRARNLASQALARALAANDPEVRALALADAYKRILEGPFRRFAWAVFVFGLKAWTEPPMVTELQERLMASGGTLAELARFAIIPTLRNSEGHETLTWDGFTDELVAEGERIAPHRVVAAFTLLRSFVDGCTAAHTAIRSAERLHASSGLPVADETGRTEDWRRVRGHFGTNGLRLLDARLNTPDVILRVEQLVDIKINPCFQALIVARRLLRRAESFAVFVGDNLTPAIALSARTVDLAAPVWKRALEEFDQIPTATFLPMNLDARSRLEDVKLATRSAAWIAVDDALGAINETPALWDEGVRKLLATRLEVVSMAVTAAQDQLKQPDARMTDIDGSLSQLRSWIGYSKPQRDKLIERHPAYFRLRAQWKVWGPAPRLPSIPADGADVEPTYVGVRSAVQTLDYYSI